MWTELQGVQAAFRKARGTRDQIANMCWIIKKAREFQKNICYNAYVKAFDTVDHNKFWKILKEMGIPDHLTCLLRIRYAAQVATVRTRHGMTDWFQIGKGICQGCIWPSALFNLHAKFISVQMLSRVQFFVTLWTVARQACCPSPISRVYSNTCPLNQWCHPTISSSVVPFSSPSIFPSIRVFSNESALLSRWPKYWSLNFNIKPSNEHSGLMSFRIDSLDLLATHRTLKSLHNTTVQKHWFFGAQLSSQSNSHIRTWLLEKPQPWLDISLLAK